MNTYSLFDICVPTSKHSAIRKLHKQFPTQLHGNKLWKANILLLQHLQQYPLAQHLRVMDIGCGWGLTSVFLKQQHITSVTAADADPNVFPYLHFLAELNAVDNIQTLTKSFAQLDEADFANIDVLLASDVCFWDEMADIHLALIQRALNAGVKKVIYSDPMRAPFLALANTCVDAFYAEVTPTTIIAPKKARGVIMTIENA